MDVLEMTRRRHGEMVVVSLAGEVDVDNAGQVRKCLGEAAATRGSRLVVDLSDLRFIDTTGLGVLVRLRADLREREGTMALVAPRRPGAPAAAQDQPGAPVPDLRHPVPGARLTVPRPMWGAASGAG
ncbi:STAS domain-containing protein [Nonomuraea lactucae]|uniref:STAS domain-containing protein n=1 Tax=Nonomuraea lactucae TaxID=2249762 RepID=UPI0019655DBC|nr:STAS domain-containing protein [Nonomuraea lactucae]